MLAEGVAPPPRGPHGHAGLWGCRPLPPATLPGPGCCTPASCALYPFLHPLLPKFPADRPSKPKQVSGQKFFFSPGYPKEITAGMWLLAPLRFCPCFPSSGGGIELTPAPAPFGGSGKACPHPKMNHTGARPSCRSARLVLRGRPGVHPGSEPPRVPHCSTSPHSGLRSSELGHGPGVLCLYRGDPKMQQLPPLPAASRPSARCGIPPLLGGKGNAAAFPTRREGPPLSRRCD